jgi:hypothetical protein
MQNAFSDALSKLLTQHIALAQTRHETLTWLAFLIMRQGTICLWRLAAHVDTVAHVKGHPDLRANATPILTRSL